MGTGNNSFIQEDGDDLNKGEEEDTEGKLSVEMGGDFSGKELNVGCNEDGDN